MILIETLKREQDTIWAHICGNSSTQSIGNKEHGHESLFSHVQATLIWEEKKNLGVVNGINQTHFTFRYSWVAVPSLVHQPYEQKPPPILLVVYTETATVCPFEIIRHQNFNSASNGHLFTTFKTENRMTSCTVEKLRTSALQHLRFWSVAPHLRSKVLEISGKYIYISTLFLHFSSFNKYTISPNFNPPVTMINDEVKSPFLVKRIHRSCNVLFLEHNEHEIDERNLDPFASTKRLSPWRHPFWKWPKKILPSLA